MDISVGFTFDQFPVMLGRVWANRRPLLVALVSAIVPYASILVTQKHNKLGQALYNLCGIEFHVSILFAYGFLLVVLIGIWDWREMGPVTIPWRALKCIFDAFFLYLSGLLGPQLKDVWAVLATLAWACHGISVSYLFGLLGSVGFFDAFVSAALGAVLSSTSKHPGFYGVAVAISVGFQIGKHVFEWYMERRHGEPQLVFGPHDLDEIISSVLSRAAGFAAQHQLERIDENEINHVLGLIRDRRNQHSPSGSNSSHPPIPTLEADSSSNSSQTYHRHNQHGVSAASAPPDQHDVSDGSNPPDQHDVSDGSNPPDQHNVSDGSNPPDQHNVSAGSTSPEQRDDSDGSNPTVYASARASTLFASATPTL